jgi:hypothetical protein
MAHRFAALVDDLVKSVSNVDGPAGRRHNRSIPASFPLEQLQVLGVAIGALPHEAFLSIAGPLFDVVKQDPDLAVK